MARCERKTRGEVPVPPSLAALLGEFRGCFSAWTFPVFCALACGLLAQSARRTVCGMLVGARLSQTWSHHRAHRFFSHARWSTEQFSAILARLVVRLLVTPEAAVSVAIDDTLFHRRGPKVHAASWFHDGSGKGGKKIGYGNNWVIAAIVVHLAFLDRPIALPVGFALVRKHSDDSSRLVLARRLVEALAVAPRRPSSRQEPPVRSHTPPPDTAAATSSPRAATETTSMPSKSTSTVEPDASRRSRPASVASRTWVMSHPPDVQQVRRAARRLAPPAP